jgi:hypothetical protein
LDVFSTIAIKLLASKLPVLRAIAQEAILCLTRTIIGSDSSSSKERVLTMMRTITERFITLRRSQVPRKWLEDVLVQRFPIFFLPSFFPILLQGIRSSTTSSFVRAELFELVGIILKRMSSFDKETQATTAEHFKTLIDTLATSVQDCIDSCSISAEKTDQPKSTKTKAQEGGTSKKLRGTLAAVKSTIDSVVRMQKDTTSLTKSLLSLKESLQKSVEFSRNTTGVSPAIAQMSEQSLQSLSRLNLEVNVEAPKLKKDKKKDVKENLVTVSSATVDEVSSEVKKTGAKKDDKKSKKRAAQEEEDVGPVIEPKSSKKNKSKK